MTLYRSASRFKFIIFLWSVIGFVLSSTNGYTQKNSSRDSYIELYSDLAVSEMRRSGIPASITMAQAILESAIGHSDLATVANNHFGIKCHLAWEGERFYYDDDAKNECFRVYKNPEDSFYDHSIFLLTRDRYKSLFELDPMDYKAWAKGLKSAGYATNPKYADLLIRIIEEERLYHLDNWSLPVNSKNSTWITEVDTFVYQPSKSSLHPYHSRNRIDFVLARKGETVKSLTEDLGMLRWEIRKYNELKPGEEIREGSLVYLQPKRKRAARGFDYHIVERGETIYNISQHFGVKTKWLLKRNNLQEGEVIKNGQRIWLRGRKKDKKK